MAKKFKPTTSKINESVDISVEGNVRAKIIAYAQKRLNQSGAELLAPVDEIITFDDPMDGMISFYYLDNIAEDEEASEDASGYQYIEDAVSDIAEFIQELGFTMDEDSEDVIIFISDDYDDEDLEDMNEATKIIKLVDPKKYGVDTDEVYPDGTTPLLIDNRDLGFVAIAYRDNPNKEEYSLKLITDKKEICESEKSNWKEKDIKQAFKLLGKAKKMRDFGAVRFRYNLRSKTDLTFNNYKLSKNGDILSYYKDTTYYISPSMEDYYNFLPDGRVVSNLISDYHVPANVKLESNTDTLDKIVQSLDKSDNNSKANVYDVDKVPYVTYNVDGIPRVACLGAYYDSRDIKEAAIVIANGKSIRDIYSSNNRVVVTDDTINQRMIQDQLDLLSELANSTTASEEVYALRSVLSQNTIKELEGLNKSTSINESASIIHSDHYREHNLLPKGRGSWMGPIELENEDVGIWAIAGTLFDEDDPDNENEYDNVVIIFPLDTRYDEYSVIAVLDDYSPAAKDIMKRLAKIKTPDELAKIIKGNEFQGYYGIKNKTDFIDLIKKLDSKMNESTIMNEAASIKKSDRYKEFNLLPKGKGWMDPIELTNRDAGFYAIAGTAYDKHDRDDEDEWGIVVILVPLDEDYEDAVITGSFYDYDPAAEGIMKRLAKAKTPMDVARTIKDQEFYDDYGNDESKFLSALTKSFSAQNESTMMINESAKIKPCNPELAGFDLLDSNNPFDFEPVELENEELGFYAIAGVATGMGGDFDEDDCSIEICITALDPDATDEVLVAEYYDMDYKAMMVMEKLAKADVFPELANILHTEGFEGMNGDYNDFIEELTYLSDMNEATEVPDGRMTVELDDTDVIEGDTLLLAELTDDVFNAVNTVLDELDPDSDVEITIDNEDLLQLAVVSDEDLDDDAFDQVLSELLEDMDLEDIVADMTDSEPIEDPDDEDFGRVIQYINFYPATGATVVPEDSVMDDNVDVIEDEDVINESTAPDYSSLANKVKDCIATYYSDGVVQRASVEVNKNKDSVICVDLKFPNRDGINAKEAKEVSKLVLSKFDNLRTLENKKEAVPQFNTRIDIKGDCLVYYVLYYNNARPGEKMLARYNFVVTNSSMNESVDDNSESIASYDYSESAKSPKLPTQSELKTIIQKSMIKFGERNTQVTVHAYRTSKYEGGVVEVDLDGTSLATDGREEDYYDEDNIKNALEYAAKELVDKFGQDKDLLDYIDVQYNKVGSLTITFSLDSELNESLDDRPEGMNEATKVTFRYEEEKDWVSPEDFKKIEKFATKMEDALERYLRRLRDLGPDDKLKDQVYTEINVENREKIIIETKTKNKVLKKDIGRLYAKGNGPDPSINLSQLPLEDVKATHRGIGWYISPIDKSLVVYVYTGFKSLAEPNYFTRIMRGEIKPGDPDPNAKATNESTKFDFDNLEEVLEEDLDSTIDLPDYADNIIVYSYPTGQGYGIKVTFDERLVNDNKLRIIDKIVKTVASRCGKDYDLDHSRNKSKGEYSLTFSFKSKLNESTDYKKVADKLETSVNKDVDLKDGDVVISVDRDDYGYDIIAEFDNRLLGSNPNKTIDKVVNSLVKRNGKYSDLVHYNNKATGKYRIILSYKGNINESAVLSYDDNQVNITRKEELSRELNTEQPLVDPYDIRCTIRPVFVRKDQFLFDGSTVYKATSNASTDKDSGTTEIKVDVLLSEDPDVTDSSTTLTLPTEFDGLKLLRCNPIKVYNESTNVKDDTVTLRFSTEEDAKEFIKDNELKPEDSYNGKFGWVVVLKKSDLKKIK